jgi:hypothetical protein
MATADQVKALIRSHAEGDDTRFYAIALQVAAQAARSGHGKFAQELRELVGTGRHKVHYIAPEDERMPPGIEWKIIRPLPWFVAGRA